MQGTVETVKWLLEHHANPEKITHSGLSALQCCLENESGTCQELIQLFKEYLLINDLKQILPAISTAVRKDLVEPLKMLYQMGVSIHVKLEQGWTSLHHACAAGALHSTEFLLTHGANWEISTDSGKTPLEIAATNQSPEQFRLMLNYIQPDLDHQNQKGETLLHLAARAGNLAHVMLLIEQGADFNIGDNQGQTPLFIAAEKSFTALVTLLMICGANPNLATSFNSKMPEDVANPAIKNIIANLRTTQNQAPIESTPLHIAAKMNHRLAIELNARIFDVNKKNIQGRTALHEAAYQGHLENIRVLLRYGADVNVQDNHGRTPLGVACLEAPHHPITIQFLLQVGADPNLESDESSKKKIKDMI